MTNSELISVGDIARMAVAMEEKGMNFYSWAAEVFGDQDVKDMFLRLAEEEKEHARLFRMILDKPQAQQQIDPNAGRYLKMLADIAGVFPHHRDINPENIKTPGDALAIGIQAEKDSILFYHELYNKTESTEVRDALSKLLEEEKLHLMELRDYMTELD